MKHIAQRGQNKGNLVTCRAKDPASCPLKNPDGTPAPHFENDEKYYEWCKDNGEAFAVTTAVVKKTAEKPKPLKKMTLSELDELAQNGDVNAMKLYLQKKYYITVRKSNGRYRMYTFGYPDSNTSNYQDWYSQSTPYKTQEEMWADQYKTQRYETNTCFKDIENTGEDYHLALENYQKALNSGNEEEIAAAHANLTRRRSHYLHYINLFNHLTSEQKQILDDINKDCNGEHRYQVVCTECSKDPKAEEKVDKLLADYEKHYAEMKQIVDDIPEQFRNSERYVQDKETDPKVLEAYSYSPFNKIRESVALNQHTPAHVLDRLSEDGNADSRIRNFIADNPNTPAETLAKMTNVEKHRRNALTALKNPSLPTDVLQKRYDELLQKYPRKQFGDNLTPTRGYRSNLSVADDEQLNAMLDNPKCPPQILEDALLNWDLDRRTTVRKVAKNPNTSTEILSGLINAKLKKVPTPDGSEKYDYGDEGEVAVAFAKHENTSEEDLVKLSTCGLYGVSKALLERDKISMSVYRNLIKSKTGWILDALRNDPKTPMKILLEMADGEDDE